MARQTRSKAAVPSASGISTYAVDDTFAEADNDKNNTTTAASSAISSSSLTPAELAALVANPVQRAMAALERLVEQTEDGLLETLGVWLGVGKGEEVDEELVGAKRAVEDLLSSSQTTTDSLFLPLPPLAATSPAQLSPLQQANLVRLVLALPHLASSISAPETTSDATYDLLWEIKEEAWRAVLSLGASGGPEEGYGKDDAGRVGRVLESGRREKERREEMLRKRAEAMLAFCSFVYTTLSSALTPDTYVDRLAEAFLPSFMGSPDQVARPGKHRGAVFRSAREKEGVLAIWADLVDERQREMQLMSLEDLQAAYGPQAVLDDLLAFVLRKVWLPFKEQQLASANAPYGFLDSQAPGERLTESVDDRPAETADGEDDDEEADDDRIDASLSVLPETNESQAAAVAGKVPAQAKGKGKGRQIAPPAPAEVEVEVGTHAMAPAADDSLEHGLSPATTSAIAGAVASDVRYVDSQESLMSSLGAGAAWGNYRQFDGGIDEYVRQLAAADESQDLYSQDDQHSQQAPSQTYASQPEEAALASVEVEQQAPLQVDEEVEALVEPPAAARRSSRAEGKKRTREPSTASVVDRDEMFDPAAPDVHGEGSYDPQLSIDPSLDDGDEDDFDAHPPTAQKKRKQQVQLRAPAKRDDNTGRGNSVISEKGYLYFQGRNETGRKAWRPEEDECLLEGMQKFEGQKMMWAKIIKEHGPKGTINQVLADRNSVSCKDRARNLKVVMQREHRDVPASLNPILVPLRHRVDQSSRAGSAPLDASAPPPADEFTAAHSLQSLSTQPSLGEAPSPVAGPSGTSHAGPHYYDAIGGDQPEQDIGHGHEIDVDPSLMG